VGQTNREFKSLKDANDAYALYSILSFMWPYEERIASL